MKGYPYTNLQPSILLVKDSVFARKLEGIMTAMKMRIGICEDDPFTLATLDASLVAKEVEVVFAETSAPNALEKFSELTPHAVLIDLHLGSGPTGLDLAKSLRGISPSVGLVFLTSFESPRLLDRSFEELPAGSQYLNKQELASVDQILHALQNSVSKNRKSTFVESSDVAGLTNRQLEVLEMIANGKSNQQIAKQLALSAKAVEGISLRIAKRLGTKNDQSGNQRIQMAKAYLRSIGRFDN
mgnify:CR=1 FL=1